MGYYQNNEYPEGSEERRLWEEKIEKKEKITSIEVDKVVRNILADKPKVTRFNIKWYVFEVDWADLGIMRMARKSSIPLLNPSMGKLIG